MAGVNRLDANVHKPQSIRHHTEQLWRASNQALMLTKGHLQTNLKWQLPN
jgi:hypothetical protein